MANAVVGALRVTLGLDSAAFENGLTEAQKKMKDAGSRLQSIGGKLATVGAGMSAAITAPVVALGVHLLQGSQDAAAAAAQVNAALESMGGASGKTAEELSATAEALRNLTGIDDDLILKDVTANLLTFGNLSGQVFDRAQVAALNLATRLGGDLKGAALQVGKALNDPIRGLTSLTRAGVSFTEQQSDQVKALVAAGDMVGAQAIILSEFDKQFKNAAKAAGDADIFTPLKIALMDLEGAFEPLIRNVAAPLVAALAGIAQAFANLPAPAQQFIAVAVGIAAAIGPVLIAVGAVVASLGTLSTAFAGGGVLAGLGVLLAPLAPIILPIAAAVAAVVAAFFLFRDDVEPVLSHLWQVAQETLGPPLQQIIGAVQELVGSFVGLMKALFETDAVQALVKFQMAYGQVLGEALIQILGTVMRVVGVVVTAISDGFKVLAALLRGDWAGAWEAYKTGVVNVMTGLRNAFSGLADWAISSMQRLVTGVATWLVQRFQQAVVEPVRQKIEAVKGFFFGLYDAVVGHSYIPDMVTEIGVWMGRNLQQAMVEPAKRAAEEVKDAMAEAQDAVRQAANAASGDGWDQTPSGQQARADAQSAERTADALDEFGQRLRDGLREAGVEINGYLDKLLSNFAETVNNLQKLFGALGGLGSGGGWSSVLAAATKFLPGFATGGSFSVGGSGTVDSKLVAFRATPGERVDISTPRQQRQQGGAPYLAQIVPSKYFDVRVQEVASPIAAQAGVGAYQASQARQQAAARAAPYRRGR